MQSTSLIITGASKGLGQSIAVAFAKALRSPLHFVLTGRDMVGLEQTRHLIELERGDSTAITTFKLHQAELCDPSTSVSLPRELFDNHGVTTKMPCHKTIFIDNAGSLGPLTTIGSEEYTLEAIQSSVNVNITSSIHLTNELVRRYSNGHLGEGKLFIVNVSTLCAVEPFECFSLYCTVKAARDMFHRVLAEEHKLNPKIKVLNYAPGPVDTNMQKEIRESSTIKTESKEPFMKMKSESTLVNASSTAMKLAKLVNLELYKSGSHIDYFDVIEGIDTPAPPTTCCGCTECLCGPDCQCKMLKAPQCGACAGAK